MERAVWSDKNLSKRENDAYLAILAIYPWATRKTLSASGKIVNKLFASGHDSIDAISNASVSELAHVGGSSNKAEKISRKAKILKELEEDIVD